MGTITGEGRDAMLNLIMTNSPWDRLAWAEKMLKTDGYSRLMEVASELTYYKHESAMEITDSTNTIVGVTCGCCYEQMWDDDRRNQIIEKIEEFTMGMLRDEGLESKVRITVGITTLLKHAPELGNSQLLMADEDEEIVKAAAGAVAMLTSASTKLCQKIYESTQWEACMLNTLANKDFEVTYRGVVIVDNVVQCGKEIAEPMMDTQVMDVCQALIAKANLDEGNAVVNETLQKIKKICDHALNLAHSMGIIKTYSQAVQEDEDDEALEPWRPHPTAPST